MVLFSECLRDAYATLAPLLPPTPLLRVDTASGALWLKCECLQPTGSFKIRGAMYRLSKLGQAEHQAGVVAYSTGNHALAIAKAAADLGIKATVVMSPDVPDAKVAATAALGASIEMSEPTSAARKAKAEAIARKTGACLVPPYDDFDIIAGQGSIAFELAEQLGGLAGVTLFVPIGGGGLIAGVAAAAKLLEPASRVIGVEPEWEADAMRSFRCGHITAADGPSQSIADAIKVQALGERTFPLIRAHVDDVTTVSESEIREASLELFEAHKLVVEPGGAVGYAAARKIAASADKRVILLGGGNITLERLNALRTSREASHP